MLYFTLFFFQIYGKKGKKAEDSVENPYKIKILPGNKNNQTKENHPPTKKTKQTDYNLVLHVLQGENSPCALKDM